MFYSHTFLARKSALGTVWIAAHLQHKIRKSHVADTNISSTVDCIMFPEVPIALRLSAFLLLGVVRIYSKKVDYLHHDCNDTLSRLRTSFASMQQVNLPENASCAPFYSITLPDTFELDALDIDQDLHFERDLDNHLKTQEEITLTDKLPAQGDPYVAFFINEDMLMDISPPSSEIPEFGTVPMEEDAPSIRAQSDVGVPDPCSSNQVEQLNQAVPGEHFAEGISDSGRSNQAEPNQTGPGDQFPQGVQDPSSSHQAEQLNQTGPEDRFPQGVQDPSSSHQAEQLNQTGPEDRSPQGVQDPSSSHQAEQLNQTGPEDRFPQGVQDPSSSHQAEQLNQTGPEDRFPQGVQDPSSSNQAENLNQMGPEDLLQSVPDVEIMRDAVPNLDSNLPDWMDIVNDNTEQDSPFEPTMNEKENLSPIMEDILPSGGESVPFKLHTDPLTAVASENADSRIPFGDASIELAIQPTPELAIQPTPPVEKQKAKPRKRKQFFDTSVVLSNSFIQEGLNDVSRLVGQRRKFPCSALDDWKFKNKKRMDQVFLEPSISGLSTNIHDMFKHDFISSKVGTISMDDTPTEDRNNDSSVPLPDLDIETERLRDVAGSSLPDFMPSPRGDATPSPTKSLGSEPHTGPILETEVLPTLDTEVLPTLDTEVLTEILPTPGQTAFTEPVDSNMETPILRSEQQSDIDNTGFSDLPETGFSDFPEPSFSNSPEYFNSAEDLHFLEADMTQAAGQEESPQHNDTLSVRTRAVAQYLKDQSPTTAVSKDRMGNLSLNKILQGKTRKQCARMFFETLVLKSYDFIYVQQDEAYGDIILSINPQPKAKSQIL